MKKKLAKVVGTIFKKELYVFFYNYYKYYTNNLDQKKSWLTNLSITYD